MEESQKLSKKQSVLIIIVSIIIGMCIWQTIGVIWSNLVASPIEVYFALIDGLKTGDFTQHFLISLMRVIIGFGLGAVFAITLGMVLGWYEKPRMLLDPWVQFVRMIPPIALVPLVVVYLGVGETAKIFIIFLTSFLYMLVTIYQGIRQIDPTLIRAAKVLGSNDLTLFSKVIMPASIPHIFTALRLGLQASWTTLVAAELIAASKGLGFLIIKSSNYFEMDNVYLGIISIGLIGIIMDRCVVYLEKRFTYWQEKAI